MVARYSRSIAPGTVRSSSARRFATSFSFDCNAAISAGASSGTRTNGVFPGTGPGTIRVLKKIPARA